MADKDKIIEVNVGDALNRAISALKGIENGVQLAVVPAMNRALAAEVRSVKLSITPMTLLFIFAVALFSPSMARASAEGRENTLALCLLAVDWRQTRAMAEGPVHWVSIAEGWQPVYYEANPLLGRHPSPGRVNGYFLALAAGYLLAQEVLPARSGRAMRRVLITAEVGCVVNNFAIGIRF